MKRCGIWFLLFSKRYFKKAGFLAALLVLPIFSLLWNMVGKEEEQGIRIALYAEENGLADEIIADLSEQDGILLFYSASSAAQLKQDVATRAAECGFIFKEGMEQSIQRGRLADQIAIVSAPSTMLDRMVSEVVFSSFMKVYGSEIMGEFADHSRIFENADRQAVKAELLKLYTMRQTDGSTFHFQYETVDLPGQEVTFQEGITFPVKGVVAVYILAIGLFFAVSWFTDRDKGLFAQVSDTFLPYANLIMIGVPVFWAGISGLTAIGISQASDGIFYEAAVLFLYSLTVVAVCNLLRCFFRNGLGLCTIIPVILIGSLLFSPIFFDFKNILPQFAVMEKVCLPSYYLLSFTKSKMMGLFTLAGLTVICTGLGFLNCRFSSRGR